MAISPTEELRRTYRLATLELEARALRTGPDWARAQAITSGHQRQRDAAETAYRAEYKTRVETALKARINQAAAMRRDHKMRGHDRFDKSALTRQAHRDVQNGHHQDLAKIDTAKADALDDLMRSSRTRNAQQGRAKESFARAANEAAPDPIIRNRARTR